MMDAIKWIEFCATVAAALAVGFIVLRGNLSNETIKLLQSNKQAQDDAIKRLEDDAKSKSDQISNLSGQVQTLKDIPLGQIAKSLEVVSQTHYDMQNFFRDYESRTAAMAANIAENAAAKVIQFMQEQNGNGKSN